MQLPRQQWQAREFRKADNMRIAAEVPRIQTWRNSRRLTFSFLGAHEFNRIRLRGQELCYGSDVFPTAKRAPSDNQNSPARGKLDAVRRPAFVTLRSPTAHDHRGRIRPSASQYRIAAIVPAQPGLRNIAH
jgi:hypothetical protein